MSNNLVWFKSDLRTDDNPALFNACQNGQPTLAVYCYCPQQLQIHAVGINHQAITLQAVKNLQQELTKLKIPLLILEVPDFSQVAEELAKLCQHMNVSQCFFNQEYLINERLRDKQVVDLLQPMVICHCSNEQTLVAPWKIANNEGRGYKVFSAFARALRRHLGEFPLSCYPVPKMQNSQVRDDILSLIKPKRKKLKVIERLPELSITANNLPDVSERYLNNAFNSFVKDKIDNYQHARDFPAVSATSNLSTGLAVGAISVKRCYLFAEQLGGEKAIAWLNELIWRDFYRSVAWHYPRVVKGQGFNSINQQLLWSNSIIHLEQWKTAKTGVPIVDAAMRQLVQTGWMHNRLRMVVASYLSKNLWIDWREGEKFFAEHLFDYDFSSNNGGWQWCASVGTDASPYFRVFNPALQQKRFDPKALFIKQWLPELAHYSAKQIHQFETKPLDNFPPMQVNLTASRKQAIDTFKSAREVMLMNDV